MWKLSLHAHILNVCCVWQKNRLQNREEQNRTDQPEKDTKHNNKHPFSNENAPTHRILPLWRYSADSVSGLSNAKHQKGHLFFHGNQ